MSPDFKLATLIYVPGAKGPLERMYPALKEEKWRNVREYFKRK